MVEKNTFKGLHEWAVILGGSSGIGLASARKLAEHGMNICILHRDRKKDLAEFELQVQYLRDLGVRVIHFNLDALKKENQELVTQKLIKELKNEGKVKLLLHSIAKGNLGDLYPFIDQKVTSNPLSEQSLILTSEAMATSLLSWVQIFVKYKLFAQDASVISLTSEGSSKTWSGYAAVGVAKAALETLSKYIATEYAHVGIKCNVIQAGVTDTPSMRMIPKAKQLKKWSIKRNPMGRLTRVEDVANVVYLLCTEEAAWINGAIIPVDGGEKNC